MYLLSKIHAIVTYFPSTLQFHPDMCMDIHNNYAYPRQGLDIHFPILNYGWDKVAAKGQSKCWHFRGY